MSSKDIRHYYYVARQMGWRLHKSRKQENHYTLTIGGPETCGAEEEFFAGSLDAVRQQLDEDYDDYKMAVKEGWP